ncbi:MAG: putative polyketide cyclase [Marmoricola sp.]|nr:putative polyketide cyclase [Marmoricola sp.]
MVSTYELSSSTVVPASIEVAFDGVMNAPLEELFPHNAGIIPSVKECTGQDGPWATVGQTRKVVTSDGNSNTETLMTYDRAGGLYQYQLSDLTGPLKALVRSVDGQFKYVAEGSGTRVTWSWSMHPTNVVTRALLPVMGFFWRQYAAKMWPLYAARLAA